MEIIDQYTRPKIETYEDRTYTATELAKAYGVTDGAVRNGWYKWLLKVAPAEALKSNKSFTSLAKALFDEFSQVDQAERHAWVADAKKRYQAEWGAVGVTQCEVMPSTVGSTLAIISNHNIELEAALAIKLSEIELFVDEISQAEVNFSEAEIKSFQAAGLQRGLQRYQIEAEAEIGTVNALRKRRLEGGQKS